jgi:hypothetical protein
MKQARTSPVKRSRQYFTDKLAHLQTQIDELDRKARLDVARACERAGLLVVEIPAKELEAALTEIAARFRRLPVKA